MSVSGVIDKTTGKFYPELIPPPAVPAVPNLNAVLGAGNSAGAQTIEDLDELETQKIYQGNYLQLELGESGDTVLLKGSTPLGVIHVGNGLSIEKLALGANNSVLVADNTQPLGVKWANETGDVESVSAGTNISLTGTGVNPIVNLANPITSQIDMGNLKIVNCLDPTGNQDVATKIYVDGKVGSVSAGSNITIGGTSTAPTVALSSPITTQIDMGNLKIVNCLDPTANQDVATKIYVDNSAPPSSWTSWTPTFTNLTVGNGTLNARYITIGKLTTVYVSFVFGATSSISGGVSITNLPVNANFSNINSGIGTALTGYLTMRDASAPQTVYGFCSYSGVSTVELRPFYSSGNYQVVAQINATTPFTWTTSDEFWLSFSYHSL